MKIIKYCYYLVYFLVPIHSSSRRMATGSSLLCRGTLAGRRTFTWCSRPIHAVILKNLIRHFHSWILGYTTTGIFIETPSLRKLSPSVLLPRKQTIHHRAPIQYFMVSGLLSLLSLLSLLLLLLLSLLLSRL